MERARAAQRAEVSVRILILASLSIILLPTPSLLSQFGLSLDACPY